jgi:hypothetical protein
LPEAEVFLVRHRAVLIAVAAIALCFSPIFLTRAAGAPQGSKPQASRQIPDLSGVWYVHGDVRSQFDFGEGSALLPWAQDQIKANQKKVNPPLLCYPAGVPRVWTEPYPFEIISLPGRVLIHHEYQHLVRQIYMDGREHPKDLIPTYMGNSIGKWDGDTLVVDTIGFNGQTWLDNTRRPLSDALHVVERIRRVNHDMLQVDITIDDPKVFAKPWSVQRTYDLKPDWEISEQVCEDNNVYLFPEDKTK